MSGAIEELSERKNIRARLWWQTHRKQCICGKSICWTAKLCRRCNALNKIKNCSGFGFESGKDAYNWKGGRRKTLGGYIILVQPSHPRADKRGIVYEHIVIWEQSHGKPLPNGWIVHHLNGVKSDNRPQNLKAFPDRKHKYILEAKARRIQELEALLNGQSQLL